VESDFGQLDVDVTIEDPKTFTKPFTIRFTERLVPDTEILEYFCVENQRPFSADSGGAKNPLSRTGKATTSVTAAARPSSPTRRGSRATTTSTISPREVVPLG
jgi:hypothetical protein